LGDLEWRTVDETKIIPADLSKPLDHTLLDNYDICVTGAALKQFMLLPSWKQLVQHTWVYARVSPVQKEFIVTSLRTLGYTTLMAGDGTNDVGALKQAHIGVALLDGTPEDLQKIAERERLERIKKVYESQLRISSRFNQPPPPVPPAIAHLVPDAVTAQQKAAADQVEARRRNPLEKVCRRPISYIVLPPDIVPSSVRSRHHHKFTSGYGRRRGCPKNQVGRCILCCTFHIEAV
jgi:manganese-transporting P-type ATPase